MDSCNILRKEGIYIMFFLKNVDVGNKNTNEDDDKILKSTNFHYNDMSRSKLQKLISNRKSFVLQTTGKGQIMEACSEVSDIIASERMRSRIYTEWRATTMLVGGPFAALAVAGIVGHNLLTLNPDYEIGRNFFTDTITVTYKK